MSLPESACIRVHDDKSEWRFEFGGFDGDDSFDSFRLTVTDSGASQQFDFCSSVVWGLRWLNRFFADQKLSKTPGGGLDIHRLGGDFRMVFEYDKKPREFHLTRPEIHLDDKFLPEYDDEEA